MNDWTAFNRDIGAVVGARTNDGTLITPAMMKNEPLFTFADGRDKGVTDILLSLSDQDIKHAMKTNADAIEVATEKMETAAQVLARTRNTMNTESATLSDKLKRHASNIKDYAERLNVSLGRFSATVNSERMAKDVENVERLVAALEKLAALEANGKLARVIEAIK